MCGLLGVIFFIQNCPRRCLNQNCRLCLKLRCLICKHYCCLQGIRRFFGFLVFLCIIRCHSVFILLCLLLLLTAAGCTKRYRRRQT